MDRFHRIIGDAVAILLGRPIQRVRLIFVYDKPPEPWREEFFRGDR